MNSKLIKRRQNLSQTVETYNPCECSCWCTCAGAPQYAPTISPYEHDDNHTYENVVSH